MAASKSRWKPWVPVGLWLVVLMVESGFGSADTTGKLFLRLWTFLLGAPSNMDTFELVHHVIRKTGHFLGYAILSILIFRALRASWRNRQAVVSHGREYFWQLRWSLFALIGTLLAASADELHQSLDPTRTGRWQDVVIDTSGALVFQIILLLVATSSARGRSVKQAEA